MTVLPGSILEAWRAHGDRIVFTNGCFDLLHPGHIQYLQEAAALGDRLVVGINDDASVSRLKGPQRPILTVTDRLEVLGALRAVDLVIPFSEDTPLRLIQAVKPHVLVKGGDYSVDTIVGADVVMALGGEVKVLSFVDGQSTSSIIERIKNL